LRVVYERLSEQLEKNGRTAWVAEEMAVLNDPAIYEQHPDNAWRRLKSRSTDGRFLAVLSEVAAWREREAQTRDLPRNRVVRDESLMEIAARKPVTVDDLARSRGVSRKLAEGVMGEGIIAAIKKGKAVPEADWPKVTKSRPPSRGIGPVIELLKVLLKIKCDENDVAQRLVANTADLERIASGDHGDVKALHGWRLELFGEDALALKAGKVSLSLRNNRIHIEHH
jgi:ribonuclease D